MGSSALTFGPWLRLKRQSLHLTQQQLGNVTGCSAAMIRKLEADERRPSPPIIERLARVLGIREDDAQLFFQFARGEQLYSPAAFTFGEMYVRRGSSTSLPIPPSSLIGRELELNMIQALLLDPSVRLVTLTGPGGVGKTHLAMSIALKLSETFADGVFFVSLAPINDPALVLPAIAQTLGIPEVEEPALLLRVQLFLRDKHLMLLLDNFEQVSAAGPQIVQLQQGALRVKILVTSRTLLRLRDEREYVLSPLAVPVLPLPPLARLLQYDAVRLFVERAQAVKMEFEVTSTNAAVVAEICARLDGLPVAIELAAARSKILQPEALLQRLGSRLQMLTGGARDLPARQQTLRATIDWSYGLLEPEEQTLFAWLAVFAGRCALDAAEAICRAGVDHTLNVLDVIQSLVNNSLLQQVDDPQGKPRFLMLETIHEYALERLMEHPEAGIVQMQHMMHYLSLAEAAEPLLTGLEQQVWLERLEYEHGNLRAALCLALERREGETALRLSAALGRFWWTRGYWREGQSWLGQALNMTETADGTLRAKGLYWMAILMIQTGDYVEAERALGVSRALCQQAGNQHGVGLALNALAVVANAQGFYGRAQALYEEGLRLYRDLGNQERVATLLNNLGFTLLIRQAYEQAVKLLDESLRLSRELRDAQGMAFALNNLGLVALRTGDIGRARSLLRESLMSFRELKDRRGSIEVLESLAELGAREGKAAYAAHLLAATTVMRETIGAHRSVHEQSRHEETLAVVRACLEDSSLATAWMEGTSRATSEAIEYALDETAL